MRAWPRGTLYTVLLALPLILTTLCGRPYAQEPSPGIQERPLGTEPVPAPAVPSSLETLPTPQERLLAPVPQQFNWIEREVLSNPLLEGLLSSQTPGLLTVSASLAETVSDNLGQSPSGGIGSRTNVVLGTVLRLDDGKRFVSLANAVSAFHDIPA